MTRQKSFVMIITAIITLLGLSAATHAQQSEHQWTSLDGPYWANGKDVAYGSGGLGQEWHRYMIGSDGSETRPFYWGESNQKWMRSNAPALAYNKVISYKGGDNGHIAICSEYDNDVWRSLDGGVNWNRMFFPSNFNRHFSSVEISSFYGTAGEYIFVGCEDNGSLASTYYSDDNGASWDILGDPEGDPLDGKYVYDIETIRAYSITAGAEDGLYMRDFGGQFDPEDDWTRIAFANQAVKVLETVDLQDDEQMAAVFDDPDWSLHYTDDGWASHQEVLIDDESFDKEVHDIAGIGWDDPAEPKTFYLATSEGLFLLKFKGNLQDVYLYDLGNAVHFGYNPLRYDNNITSVDYYFYEEGNQKHAKILASTRYNVYEIHETRDIGLILDIFSVEFSEVVTGTYLCNVVGISFPENDLDDRQIFTVTENALIKKYDDTGWRLVSLAFTGTSDGIMGTDIVTDFSEFEKHILVSSQSETSGGTIMLSSDGGETWLDVTPASRPKIVGVALEPGWGFLSSAYAVSGADEIWVSEDNGLNWQDPWYEYGVNFRGVTATDGTYLYFAYAFGSGTGKIFGYDGNTWERFDDGLESVTAVNQVIECGDFDLFINYDLYAATTDGVYKFGQGTWSPRRTGMPIADLGTIVWDPNGVPPKIVPEGKPHIEFFTATSKDLTPPRLWASGDSGRSWIDRGNIGAGNSINELAAPWAPMMISPLGILIPTERSGFAAATDSGVFYIGDIFKQGFVFTDDEWGPGAVILNSDIAYVNWFRQPELTLRITPPCTVFAVYDFDANRTNRYIDKAEILFHGNYRFEAIGNSTDDIIFTSSRSSGGVAGDWGGIEYAYGPAPGAPDVDLRLSYCLIEFAETGIHDYLGGGPSKADTIVISDCKFRDNGISGILIDEAEIRDSLHIENSVFERCGDYGIMIDDQVPNTSIWITDNEITDSDYGIRYSGNQDPTYENIITIRGNTISRASPGANTYGISLSKFDSQGNAPVSTIKLNSISNFAYGMDFNSITGESVLWGNTVQNCSDYGLFLASSSPSLIGEPLPGPNTFRNNSIGIYCDENSSPHVRKTRIKDNEIGGVLIESHDFTPVPPPDFGTVRDWGNNSFSHSDAPPQYYDMKYITLSSRVSALRNWWGEPFPIPWQIVGNIDYIPYLTEDPLAPHPKREPWYSNLPDDFGLWQNFPNPFNPTTSLSFYIAEPGFASLKIYNLKGQLVNTLVSDHMGSGEHTVIWDSKNSAGQEVSSGIYFYILDTDYGKASKKMVLLR